METLVISDHVRGCELETVEVDIETIRYRPEGVRVQNLDIRVFFPSKINGKDAHNFAYDWVWEKYKRANGDEREYYRFVNLMLMFHGRMPELHERAQRAFNIKTLDYSHTWKEIADTLKPVKQRDQSLLNGNRLFYPPNGTQISRLMKLAGKSPDSTPDLFSRAAFMNDFPKMDCSREEYEFFRANALEDVRRAASIGVDLRDCTFDDNPLLALLSIEAESIFHGLIGAINYRVYRKIRHRMTMPECRAFQALFFRQPFLNHRVAALDVVAGGFMGGMDRETKILTLLAIPHKLEKLGDHFANIPEELKQRWRAYLMFYPTWVFIQRADDRMKDQDARYYGTLSLDYIYENDDGDEWSMHDCIDDTKWLNAVLDISRRDTLSALVERYCTERQAEVMFHLGRGKRQNEVALQLDISQAMVSKHQSEAIERIREGLRRDGRLDD